MGWRIVRLVTYIIGLLCDNDNNGFDKEKGEWILEETGREFIQIKIGSNAVILLLIKTVMW